MELTDYGVVCRRVSHAALDGELRSAGRLLRVALLSITRKDPFGFEFIRHVFSHRGHFNFAAEIGTGTIFHTSTSNKWF